MLQQLQNDLVCETISATAADNQTNLPVVLGSRRPVVVRLRGWERNAWLVFGIAGAANGGLALAGLLGASISHAVVQWAEVVTGAAAIAAIIGLLLAMARYDGETTDLPPRRGSRLISRFRRRP